MWIRGIRGLSWGKSILQSPHNTHHHQVWGELSTPLFHPPSKQREDTENILLFPSHWSGFVFTLLLACFSLFFHIKLIASSLPSLPAFPCHSLYMLHSLKLPFLSSWFALFNQYFPLSTHLLPIARCLVARHSGTMFPMVPQSAVVTCESL